MLKYVLVGGRWELEREEIEPDNAPLVTTWTYYGPDEATGPGGSAERKDKKTKKRQRDRSFIERNR